MLFLAVLLPVAFCTGHEAIFLGCSGLVGNLVLQELLNSLNWDAVHCVVRQPLSQQHPKLKSIVVPDLNTLATNPKLLELAKEKKDGVPVAFITLGLNEPFGMTIKDVLLVEVTLSVIFAQFCRSQLNTRYVALLSGAGADRSKSYSQEELNNKVTYLNMAFHYPTIKGVVENAVAEVGIPWTVFYEPANFETDEYRFGYLDMFLQGFFHLIKPISPRKFRSIHVKDLAHAMFLDADRAVENLEWSTQHLTEVKLYDDFFDVAAAAAAAVTKKKTDVNTEL
eukprot:g73235.t1